MFAGEIVLFSIALFHLKREGMEAGESTAAFLEVLFQALEMGLPRREQFSSL